MMVEIVLAAACSYIALLLDIFLGKENTTSCTMNVERIVFTFIWSDLYRSDVSVESHGEYIWSGLSCYNQVHKTVCNGIGMEQMGKNSSTANKKMIILTSAWFVEFNITDSKNLVVAMGILIILVL